MLFVKRVYAVCSVSYAQFTLPARHDKTVLYVSCRWCELSLETVWQSLNSTCPMFGLTQLTLPYQTWQNSPVCELLLTCSNFKFPVGNKSCLESGSYRPGRHVTYRTVLLKLSWQYELGSSQSVGLSDGWTNHDVICINECEDHSSHGYVLDGGVYHPGKDFLGGISLPIVKYRVCGVDVAFTVYFDCRLLTFLWFAVNQKIILGLSGNISPATKKF